MEQDFEVQNENFVYTVVITIITIQLYNSHREGFHKKINVKQYSQI